MCDLSTEAELVEENPVTVWDHMVFSFDLTGVSLTLYSKEKDLVSHIQHVMVLT